VHTQSTSAIRASNTVPTVRARAAPVADDGIRGGDAVAPGMRPG
jgi:hypothetical protein